jgi:pimeloyl-ACP methyl ester carboxylesterase
MVLADSVPVLLIRGLTREQRHWGAFRPLLAQQLANPLCSYDFAGCGALYRQRSAASIAGLCQSVRAQWLAERGQQQHVHLVALSLGGMLALYWALHWPDEVASLSLINSSAKPLSAFYQRLQWRQYPALLKLIMQTPAQREQQILALSSASPIPPQLLQQWQRWQQQRPVSSGNRFRQLWAASRFYVTAKPQCRVLVLSSRGDKLVAPQCSAALAQFCCAEHLQHHWAGHDIALDDPHWLSAQLVRFISGEG